MCGADYSLQTDMRTAIAVFQAKERSGYHAKRAGVRYNVSTYLKLLFQRKLA